MVPKNTHFASMSITSERKEGHVQNKENVAEGGKPV